jgi:peroxiredoxin
LLVAGLIAASVLVLVLSVRLRQLAVAYRDLRRLALLPHPGVVVPTFRAATIGGDSVTVGELPDSAGTQVLLVFNTTCPFCRSIIPLWRQLAESLDQTERVQVLGISLDSPDSTFRYVTEHLLRFPVLTFPQPKLARLYRAVAVPQTVVVDSAGTVLYARTGTLDSSSLDSVYAAVTRRRGR